MSILGSLNREQKEAVGLLQIGTFLEYFDLMLYVHMAVLLNEIFFPKTDPHTASLVVAFAFCSTWVFRPFGALIFGWLGDNIGRKTTVIITTMMMSLSCIIMATLPTYAQIGISATWIMTACRIVQGLSSMGECIGSEIYITEITKPPVQYPAAAFVGVASATGSMVALGVATLVTKMDMNWRAAFWMGATIAVIGSVARTRLRETPDFLLEKSKKNKILQYGDVKKTVSRQTMLAYFFIGCGWPMSFYICYIYFNPTLSSFGYTPEDIISHNFFLSIVAVITFFVLAIMSYKKHPLLILKIRGFVFLLFATLLPVLIILCRNPWQIGLLQVILLIFSLSGIPSAAVMIKHFPVLRRFMATSFLYAATRAIMYVVTSFGLVYLTDWFGHYGLWIIMLPITAGFLLGIRHFEGLEGLRPIKAVNQASHDVLQSRAG